jgi:hypothetical protein
MANPRQPTTPACTKKHLARALRHTLVNVLAEPCEYILLRRSAENLHPITSDAILWVFLRFRKHVCCHDVRDHGRLLSGRGGELRRQSVSEPLTQASAGGVDDANSDAIARQGQTFHQLRAPYRGFSEGLTTGNQDTIKQLIIGVRRLLFFTPLLGHHRFSAAI